VHWSNVGDPRASDAVIMKWSLEHGSYVLTHDLDFTAILALAGAAGPSVIQVRTQNVPASRRRD
jgi:predicted nuclease of predicted toxin-antitoxin system